MPPPPPDDNAGVEFELAVWYATSKEVSGKDLQLSTDLKLQLYGLFKRSTAGALDPVTNPRPNAADGMSKCFMWDSYQKGSAFSAEDAMAKYVKIVSDADSKWLERAKELNHPLVSRLQKVESFFVEADIDCNGAVTKNEFKQWHTAQGQAPTVAQWGVFNSTAGEDGVLSREEFNNYVTNYSAANDMTGQQMDAGDGWVKLGAGAPASETDLPFGSPTSVATDEISLSSQDAGSPEGATDPARVDEITQSIHSIYEEHAPHKKANVAGLIKKHRGKEEHLYRLIKHKYDGAGLQSHLKSDMPNAAPQPLDSESLLRYYAGGDEPKLVQHYGDGAAGAAPRVVTPAKSGKPDARARVAAAAEAAAAAAAALPASPEAPAAGAAGGCMWTLCVWVPTGALVALGIGAASGRLGSKADVRWCVTLG
jgi:acyl-CoA-binding protein